MAAVLLTALVVLALVRAFRRDGPAALAAWQAANVDPVWISVATAAGLLGHGIFVFGWKRLLADCGVRIGFWKAARLFLAALSWIGWGIALYAIAAALLGDPGGDLVTYVAAWIGPFLAGLVAAFAPAGLGVRDELMRTMLANAGVETGAALVLMVVARVWTTLMEVVPAILVLALRRMAAQRVVGYDAGEGQPS